MTERDVPIVSSEPGGTLRLVVGDDDAQKYSLTWRLWTSPNNPDVYLGARQGVSTAKVSFHNATGSWSFSFVRDEVKPEWAASRHMAIWPRPTEVAPGLVNAFLILVPPSAPSALNAKPGRSVTVVPAQGPNVAILIEVLIAQPGAVGSIAYDEGRDIAAMLVSDGSQVRVIAHVASWDNGDQEWLEQLGRDALASRPGGPLKGRGCAAYFGELIDGRRAFIDLGEVGPERP
ncbi:MAG: hypothetical protein M3256_10330 [Actinomycetota bacterium]|nr:hypothetical protein [Actinomycetota bacterium]